MGLANHRVTTNMIVEQITKGQIKDFAPHGQHMDAHCMLITEANLSRVVLMRKACPWPGTNVPSLVIGLCFIYKIGMHTGYQMWAKLCLSDPNKIVLSLIVLDAFTLEPVLFYILLVGCLYPWHHCVRDEYVNIGKP